MSKSTYQAEIRAVDKTSGAFDSIKKRAAATGASIRQMLGGALATAGVYLGLKQIIDGINELGRLSDIATRTGTSVDELTRATAAFNALGVQMSAEKFARAMDYMQKATGETGLEGFKKTIKSISDLESETDRAQAAMAVFGRSGMEFMPLINAADEGVDALSGVIDAMSGIPQSAADAGDAASDALGFAANSVKSVWLQGLGAVIGWFDNEYVGGVREASLKAGNAFEYYAKTSVAKAISWYQKVREYLKRFGEAVGTFVGTVFEGGSFGEAWDAAGAAYDQAVQEYEDAAAEIDRTEAERTDRFKKYYDDKNIDVEKFARNYQKATSSLAKRREREARRADEAAIVKQTKISNELIMGGNAAAKLGVLGPTFQIETKKQTSILEKIAKNTEKTAAHTSEISGQDDLGVID